MAPAGSDDISEDICVAFSDAVVQLDALELEGVLRRHQLQFKARSEKRKVCASAFAVLHRMVAGLVGCGMRRTLSRV